MPRLPSAVQSAQEWVLPVGLAPWPGWRAAARVATLAVLALGVVWWVGLVRAWNAGQGVHGAAVLLGSAGLLGWAWWAWLPLWRSVREVPRTLTLIWQPVLSLDPGLPPRPSPRLLASPWMVQRSAGAPPEPVRLVRVLDLQRWLVLRVVSAQRARAAARWLIVRDVPGDQAAHEAIHRLRVLMSIAAHGSTSIPDGQTTVASSRMTAGPSVGSTPPVHMKQAMRHPSSATSRRAATGTSHASRRDDASSAFLPTRIDADRRGR